MAGKFSLTSKFGIVSAVLLLLSVGLCGIGVSHVSGGAAPDILVPAGLVALGLGLLGLAITIVMAIVQAVSGRSAYGVHPPSLPEAPPAPPPVLPPAEPKDHEP